MRAIGVVPLVRLSIINPPWEKLQMTPDTTADTAPAKLRRS